MAQSYWVRHNGVTHGPYENHDIRSMARSGDIGPDAELSPDKVHWKRCGDISGLFPKAEGVEPNSFPSDLSPSMRAESKVENIESTTTPTPDSKSPPSPMADVQWFYRKGGSSIGPVTAEEIASLIKRRVITTYDVLWSENMSKWMPARKIPQFSADIIAFRSVLDEFRWANLFKIGAIFAIALIFVQYKLDNRASSSAEPHAAGNHVIDESPVGQWICKRPEAVKDHGFWIVEVRPRLIRTMEIGVSENMRTRFEGAISGVFTMELSPLRSEGRRVYGPLNYGGSTFTNKHMLAADREAVDTYRILNLQDKENMLYGTDEWTLPCRRRDLRNVIRRIDSAMESAAILAEKYVQTMSEDWYSGALMIRNSGYCQDFRNEIIEHGAQDSSFGNAVARRLLPIMEGNGCLAKGRDDFTFPLIPGMLFSTLELTDQELDALYR